MELSVTLSEEKFLMESMSWCSPVSFYNKTQEFRTWLLEEHKLNPEALSKYQE